MARFKVNSLYSVQTMDVGYEVSFRKWWLPWSKDVVIRPKKFECKLSGHVVILVGNHYVRELHGKISECSWEFEADVPDGPVRVIPFGSSYCEIERIS